MKGKIIFRHSISVIKTFGMYMTNSDVLNNVILVLDTLCFQSLNVNTCTSNLSLELDQSQSTSVKSMSALLH